MDNEGRLYSQVAAQAGVAPEKALAAVYLSNLARSGKTIDQACALARMERSDVRDVARDWGFSFSDYVPAPAPLSLCWIKPARGEWTLMLGGEVVARILTETTQGVRQYRATWERDSAHMMEVGSAADIAARRLSKRIDRQSISLFGVDDVLIAFVHTDGRREHLAPAMAQDAPKLRAALSA